MSPNLTAALLMVAAMAAFTCNDVFVKLTGGALPLWQLLFLRGVLASTLILGLGLSLKAIRLRMSRGDWVVIGVRSASEIGAAYFFITALFAMPLANVTSILQFLPLMVTLGAALFFAEPLGWRRMTAIGVGFLGMLLIVKPGAEGFNLMSLYAIGAVICVTVRDLVTRKLSAEASSITVTFIASLSVMAFGGIASVPQGWNPLTPQLVALLAGSSMFIFVAYYCSVQVMRQGEIGFVAPFRYTALVFALILGWLVFGEWPDALTLIGAAIIVATGLFTLWREQQIRR